MLADVVGMIEYGKQVPLRRSIVVGLEAVDDIHPLRIDPSDVLTRRSHPGLLTLGGWKACAVGCCIASQEHELTDQVVKGASKVAQHVPKYTRKLRPLTALPC